MPDLATEIFTESVQFLQHQIPVTIVTGFLGSGKTTLLNHILNNRQGWKVAVIVNEFGDIDIDSQLLVAVDENMVQLANGCICCTINQSLVDAVWAIAKRVESIDYLVIETTGIADPLPIVRSLTTTALQQVTRVDSVLTLVDAESFTSAHYSSEAALNQLIFGDIILLNKTDLVAPEIVADLEHYIRSIAPNARIIATEHGRVPLPLILDVGIDRTNVGLESPKSGHEHSHHLENDGFVAVSFESDLPLILPKFQDFLDRLSPDVCRAKGILKFQGSQLHHVLQMSGKRYEMKSISVEKSASRSPPLNANQLVFIGRNLNAEAIRTQITECLAI
ncbi:CobW family GTP-binding protein [Chamaesiphon polymorphus]|uniref:Cobalamin biosynthesis protein CobW n=1 Tax=Chamaesiphon polymorphus CCALA 037 TaxID=2107692 RepID=A0A2T1FVW1_9CYAN|nr:GTP-binding protein [Chamaesiphon polymorphus]PSB49133.1 cobalamin biosynthesis protein CobW [Chamaesiphon polymorphus CCALA 037]